MRTVLILLALLGPFIVGTQGQAVESTVPTYQHLLAYAPPAKKAEPLTHPTVSWPAEQQHCLALNIFYEAGVEDLLGKLAVGTVTMNRLTTGRWGQSICDVVYARKQFSWTLKKQEPPTGSLWEASKEAAALVLQEHQVYDLSNSLHYHADYVVPSWAASKQVVAQIGRHIFYEN